MFEGETIIRNWLTFKSPCTEMYKISQKRKEKKNVCIHIDYAWIFCKLTKNFEGLKVC